MCVCKKALEQKQKRSKICGGKKLDKYMFKTKTARGLDQFRLPRPSFPFKIHKEKKKNNNKQERANIKTRKSALPSDFCISQMLH